MTNDEVKAIADQLAAAKMSDGVKVWLDVLKKLADDLIIQEYNASGENAVRALGVQKGIGMALKLDEIFASSVKSSLVMPEKKIVRP